MIVKYKGEKTCSEIVLSKNNEVIVSFLKTSVLKK